MILLKLPTILLQQPTQFFIGYHVFISDFLFKSLLLEFHYTEKNLEKKFRYDDRFKKTQSLLFSVRFNETQILSLSEPQS